VPEAQSTFDSARFLALLSSTAYVSEVGIDRRSRVPMDTQVRVLSAILESLQDTPRLTSIHSSGAPTAVLDVLARHRIKGAVLHWWRGDESQTRRAIELGCWFSVNAAGMKHPTDVATIPLDRIFTETDHPSGNRGSVAPRQPGVIHDVEMALARLHGISATAVRKQVWKNLACVVNDVGVLDLLPVPVRRMLAVANP
jgi:TatD DNase family protein